MRYIQAIQRLSAAERQALSEWYLEGREYWNAENRPALADYCNERAGDLWDEAKRQEAATRALEVDFSGAAELLPDDDEDQSAYCQWPSEIPHLWPSEIPHSSLLQSLSPAASI